jgi:putative transposase
MPRPILFRTRDFAYHVTARSNNKEWFYVPTEACWNIFCGQLSDSAQKYQLLVHAFVLMSNHYHLLVSTPLGNLDDAMRHFQTQVSRSIQRWSTRINHVFGGRYHWSVLGDSCALAYVYKYVYRNPVRAGICDTAESYQFSSISSKTHTSAIPLIEGFNNYWNFVPKDPAERLEWLNRPARPESEDLVKRTLRRSHFQFSKSSNVQANLRMLRADYGIQETGW